MARDLMLRPQVAVSDSHRISYSNWTAMAIFSFCPTDMGYCPVQKVIEAFLFSTNVLVNPTLMEKKLRPCIAITLLTVLSNRLWNKLLVKLCIKHLNY